MTPVWDNGYVADVAYPAFFYRELQPVWLTAVAAFLGDAGVATDSRFSWCDLGCGSATNLLVAAACHPRAHFVGVDADDAALAVARNGAAAAGLDNIRFVGADFAAFARTNRTRFDVMTCHGIWSWMAQDQRAALLDAVTTALAPDGAFVLHYMCHPGSTDLLPIQHLLNLSAHHMPGSSMTRAQTGLRLLRRLVDSGLYADRPDMMRHVARLEARDPADLAHEFLTDHWHPQHSADVHQQVARAGMSFAGSAEVFNNLDPSLSIPGQLQPLIQQARIPALAETLKDMARRSHQRIDIFRRHRARSAPADATIDSIKLTLLPDAPPPGPVRFATPIGTIDGPEAIFGPLLTRLHRGAASVAELSQLERFASDRAALLSAVQLLMMKGIAHPVLPAGDIATDRVERLQHWFDSNGIAQRIVAACGTAVASVGRAASPPRPPHSSTGR